MKRSSQFSRTAMLLGEDNMKKLSSSRVAVFGIGGVGSYAVEALVRNGVENLDIIDYDIIDITNINRQVHASMKTVGRSKVEVMKDRLREINPRVKIRIYEDKYSPENKNIFDLTFYDYILDCIDTISAKKDLIINAKSKNIPIISAMGAANKLDPTQVNVGDIYKTSNCPLARVMRRELRKNKVEDLKVVWSTEDSLNVNMEKKDRRKSVPASAGLVPPVFGLVMASEVIKDLINLEVN